MKRGLLLVFLLSCLQIYSQTDSTSGLDYLYKESRKIGKAQRAAKRNFGCSVFGGVGDGGNDLSTALAFGGNIRFHYGVHTLCGYASRASGSDIYTLNGNYGGVTYGFGYYGKKLCLGAGMGYAYSSVHMSVGEGANYKTLYYLRNGFCVGGQFSFMFKYIGVGAQVYYNFTNARNDFTFLGGIEIRIWEDCLRKKPEEEITPAPRSQ